jgi:hypothetical protein
LLSITLEGRNPVSHVINQDFSSPTRDRPKAGLLEPQDNLTQWQPEYFSKVIKLRRTECVNVDLRIFLPDVIQQVEVIVYAQLRVVTALHQYLDPSDGHKFINLPIDIFVTQNVMICVPLCSIECTKLAINIANVCVIDIAIDDVRDNLASPTVKRLGLSLLPALIG